MAIGDSADEASEYGSDNNGIMALDCEYHDVSLEAYNLNSTTPVRFSEG